jgi:hypothetical protein
VQGRRAFAAVAIASAMAASIAACGGSSGSGTGAGSTDASRPGATTSSTAPAPPPPQQLVASDGAKGDNLGGDVWYNTFATPVEATYYATPGEAAMSSDGAVAVVGVPGHSNGAKIGAGAVYVFTRQGSTYTQTAKLVAADGSSYDGFGWSVAISGDGHDIMAGAAYDDVAGNTDVGSVYFFHQTGTTWTQVAEVRAKDAGAYDGFGFAVALSRDGRTAVAGAPSHAVNGHRGQGAAYIFKRSGTGWTQAAQLLSGGGRPQDDFGAAAAVSADGTTIAVTKASHIPSDKVLHVGATYVFRSLPGQAPKQVAIFPDTNRNADKSSDAYGVNASFSDDGNLLAIAAPDVNVGKALGAGAVYVYSTTANWSVPAHNATTEILPTEPVNYGYYGSCVAFSSDGTALWIGVDGVGSNGQGGGDLVRASAGTAAAWKDASQLTHTVVDAPNVKQGRYGTAVAMSADGKTLLATAPWLAVEGKAKQGAAYVSMAPNVNTP